MNINRNNYEVFFIDYYDGNLSDAQTEALMLFLSDNPDLEEEFAQFKSVSVPADKITFPGKKQLKKQEIVTVSGITEENYEEFFVAFCEKDLNEEEQKSLKLFLEANPYLQKEFALHRSLTLEPTDITYSDKAGLKKKAAIGYYWYAGAVAAFILLLLALNFLTRQQIAVPSHQPIEIAGLKSLNYSGDVAQNFQEKLILVTKKYLSVTLPVPEARENLRIPLLASIDIDHITSGEESVLIFNDFSYHTQKPIGKAEKPRHKSLLAQVIRTSFSKIKNKFGIEQDRPKRHKKGEHTDEPGFVRLLDRSLMVFNTITGSDKELVKDYDAKGRLKNYRLQGEAFTISRKVPPGRSSE